MKCKNCGVDVLSKNGICPLCGKTVGAEEDYPSAYPDYTPPSSGRLSLLFFISVAAAILCGSINFLTYSVFPHLWSVMIIGLLFYLWVLVHQVLQTHAHKGKKLLINFFVLSAVLIVIDAANGFSRWSVNYVIPFAAIGSSVIITVIVLRRKFLWEEYIGYFLATILINFLPIVLYATGVATVFWCSYVAMIYAIIALIGMIILRRRQFFEEIRNRFRY